MGRPELAIRHSGAHPAKDHRIAVVGDVHLDLLETPAGQERRRAADEGQETAIGEACGHADHILLGDPDIDEAVGERFLELGQIAGADAVVADSDDARIGAGELDERFGEGRAAVEGFCLRGDGSVHCASSFNASSTCSGLGTL